MQTLHGPYKYRIAPTPVVFNGLWTTSTVLEQVCDAALVLFSPHSDTFHLLMNPIVDNR